MTINGKEYGLLFGLHAIESLSATFGITYLNELDEILKNIPVKNLFTFVYILIENWCIANSVDMPDAEDIRRELNRDFMGVLSAVNAVTNFGSEEEQAQEISETVDPGN